MIIKGQFKDINNENTYFVKIGNIGIEKIIQDDVDKTISENIICFAGKSPVKITSDVSDTFENVYIRECSINLITNFDIRADIIAYNYTDVPVEVRYNNEYGNIIFSGFVLPLSFDQPFAQEWNEFTLNCVDKLGILEYIDFPPLLEGDTNYNTPRYFMGLALEQCNFSSITYNIEYDHTLDTNINPAIFSGESQDDWMNCKDVLSEIGKIYGCWYWQDGDSCKVENTLLYELSNPYNVTQDDYRKDDANISIQEAYNMIKCTVDISNLDETFIDPFSDDYLNATTRRGERVLSELAYKNKNHLFAELGYWQQISPTVEEGAGFMGYIRMDAVKDYFTRWDIPVGYVSDYEAFQVYEHYAQILENKLFDFGEHNYLNDGHGSDPTGAVQTLAYLKSNPGKAAFVSFGSTDNVRNQKNNSAVKAPDMKNMLLLQIGGHSEETGAEMARLEQQILDNIPVCSFEMQNAVNLVPYDISTTNYLVISGRIKLNPLHPRTGPVWEDATDYERSTNTIPDCIYAWNFINWDLPIPLVYRKNSLYSYSTEFKDFEAYYQYYIWQNNPQSLEPYPYNQIHDFSTQIALPYLASEKKQYKYEDSAFRNNEGKVKIDLVDKIGVLVCELKIGDKYLVENPQMLQSHVWAMSSADLQRAYTWKTLEECEVVDGERITYFTVGFNPGLDEEIVGRDFDIQDTCSILLNIDAKGFAIPLPYDAGLVGKMTFRILGPYNTTWSTDGYVNHGPLWWKSYINGENEKLLLSHIENIQVSNLSFKLYSDLGGATNHNLDNDLVYYSEENNIYVDSQEFDCKFCTSLTSDEVYDLDVDYKINNSAILDTTNHPWYGMTYNHVENVKLEEARVSEQYKIWSKPRNIIEMTLRCMEPDKGLLKQNFTFNYVNGIYKAVSRDIDLKNNTMKCTMKDFTSYQ